MNNQVISEQIQTSLKSLLEALNEAPHSFDLRIYRYVGEKEKYQCTLTVTNLDLGLGDE